MNMIKKFFASLVAIAAMTIGVNAQLISLGNASYGYASATANITNGGFQLLALGAFEFSEIQVQSDGTNACTVQFYDDPYGNGKWTNALYYDRIGYTSNLVSNVHTNAEGIIETNTYSGVMWTAIRTNAIATNSFVALTSIAVPVYGVVTRVGKWDFSRGVTIQASTNCTLSFSYRKLY